MAKHTVTINSELLDGVEITGVSLVRTHASQPGVADITVTIRPVWQPPAWLKPGSWIWSNDGNNWCVSMQNRDEGTHTYSIIDIRDSSIDFTPPPWTDAKSSLRQIPGGEA